MVTPYDWQEGIGNRAAYIEGKLAQGAPVLAVSLDAGIVVFTFRRQARKVAEIYDRLIFGAIGQQSDVEAIRNTALEFAHREGYNRSEEDVTIRRVATALSEPLKRAFGDFGVAPFVVRCLFAEVNERPEDDLYYTLDFDGDYSVGRHHAAVAGTQAAADELHEKLSEIPSSTTPAEALALMESAWVHSHEGGSIAGLSREAVLLERSGERENRFRSLTAEDV